MPTSLATDLCREQRERCVEPILRELAAIPALTTVLGLRSAPSYAAFLCQMDAFVKNVAGQAHEAGKFLKLANALDLPLQTQESAAGDWHSADVWTEMVDYLREAHVADGKTLFLRPTKASGRATIIRSIMQGRLRLLWANLGGVNEDVWDEETSAEFLRSAEANQAYVFVTFGPTQEDARSAGHVINTAGFERILSERPILRQVRAYRDGAGRGRVVVVQLRERMENHFILTVRDGLLGRFASVVLESLHHEGQEERLTMMPESPRAIAVEAALALRHLLGVRGGEEGPATIWNVPE